MPLKKDIAIRSVLLEYQQGKIGFRTAMRRLDLDTFYDLDALLTEYEIDCLGEPESHSSDPDTALKDALI